MSNRSSEEVTNKKWVRIDLIIEFGEISNTPYLPISPSPQTPQTPHLPISSSTFK